MPKFEINATELTDTDVNFVALVKRGANRIPFRITKGSDAMLDLYSVGRKLFKKADSGVTVHAAIVQKGADLPAIVSTLKSVGIDVAAFEKADQDGLVTLTRKTDEKPADVMLIKMSGDVALAVTGLKKGFSGYDFSSSDFGDVHATGSYCSSLSVASDMLQMTISNILYETESPTDAESKISDAIDGFKDYISTLTSALPVQAFKADQALLKAEVELAKAAVDPKKHPHAGVAMAIAHAAHAAASAANQAGTMLGTGDASGGTDDDQETGDTSGAAATQSKPAKPAKKADGTDAEDADGDEAAKALAKEKAKKADAGKNGTGAGFEAGAGTGTTSSATSDDEANTEVDAKPGAKTSGSDDGMPAKAKAKKADLVNQALALLAKANSMDPDKDGDDDSIMTGESQAGEGAAQAPEDSTSAEARGTTDDGKAGGAVAGKVKGKTLDTTGIPEKALASTAKNDGDAEAGKKGKGNNLADDLSGSGAQENDVQTLKADSALMKMVQTLAKTVETSLAGVTKSVHALNTRVDQVAEQAKKTDAALNGTVFNEDGGDVVRAKKSEREAAPALLDTGYSRRVA